MTQNYSGALTRRRFLVMGSTTLAVTLLAACSSGQAPATSAPAPTSASASNGGAAASKPTVAPTTAPASSTSASSSGPATIEFLNIGALQQTVTLFSDKLIPAFAKAQPSITVHMQTIDWGPSFQKISTAVASGTAPDVFVMGGIFTDPLASKGALLQIDDRVARWDGAKDIYPNVWSDSKYQGKTYAVPMNLEPQTIVYRKDFYQSAGLKPPETWDDLKAAARKLVKKNGSAVQVEGMDWNLTNNVSAQQSFINLLYQAGGDYFDAS